MKIDLATDPGPGSAGLFRHLPKFVDEYLDRCASCTNYGPIDRVVRWEWDHPASTARRTSWR